MTAETYVTQRGTELLSLRFSGQDNTQRNRVAFFYSAPDIQVEGEVIGGGVNYKAGRMGEAREAQACFDLGRLHELLLHIGDDLPVEWKEALGGWCVK